MKNVGEWVEVRRRKPQSTTNITTFYVSNIQQDTTVNMLSEAFRKYDKIVDIYIPGRKDRAGSYFTFVKYSGIKESQAMLNSMNQVRCRQCILKVNVAKYEKRYNQYKQAYRPHRGHHVQSSTIPGVWSKISEGKSFAEAVTGRKEGKLVPSVSLNRILAMKPEAVLTGEVISFHLLNNLPELLKKDGISPREVFYVGGLKIILRFSLHEDASGYLMNEQAWSKWFKWLNAGFAEDVPFERMAWIKIVGLPIQLRSEENVNLIAGKIGKVIEVDNCQNWHGINLSSPHARILTGSKTLINLEINCNFLGTIFTVGVIETKYI
ncbi:unnamed protein product [Lactuca virosa]|uniref:RRM domain-containing protein n=1 Tax=Lactuca virosa TaxID=75947 RepID=A0AAU9LSD0_9ASTR|nr:unnamed protein product [Lactuca virosa]